jgi:organic radical activating enzyme
VDQHRTLCNLACRTCYIESSPRNDALVYISLAEAEAYLDEAQALGTREIGFTGGEPFMNPDMIAMLQAALVRGFEALVLTKRDAADAGGSRSNLCSAPWRPADHAGQPRPFSRNP